MWLLLFWTRASCNTACDFACVFSCCLSLDHFKRLHPLNLAASLTVTWPHETCISSNMKRFFFVSFCIYLALAPPCPNQPRFSLVKVFSFFTLGVLFVGPVLLLQEEKDCLIVLLLLLVALCSFFVLFCVLSGALPLGNLVIHTSFSSWWAVEKIARPCGARRRLHR